MKLHPLSLRMMQLYGLAVIFFTANAVLTIIFPLEAADGGYLEGEIGVMMAMYMLVCMLLRPFAGQMVAKHSPYTIMQWLLIGHALALLIYVVFGIDSVFLVRALQGIITAFFSMAMQLGITDVLQDHERGQGMSMYSLSSVVPGLYGPAVALLLWTQFDKQDLLIFVVMLALLPLLFFIGSPLPKAKEDTDVVTTRELIAAMKGAKQHKGLVISAIVMVLGAAIFGAITTFLPLFMLTEGVGNPAIYLTLQALVVVSSRFLLRRSIPSDGQWHPKFMACVLFSSMLGTTLLAVLPEIGSFVYISAVFNGLASAMLYPTITTYMSFVVPKESRNILLGLFLATYDLGFGLGGFLMGFIVQFTSYMVMFMVCTVLATIALWVVLLNRNPDRQISTTMLTK